MLNFIFDLNGQISMCCEVPLRLCQNYWPIIAKFAQYVFFYNFKFLALNANIFVAFCVIVLCHCCKTFCYFVEHFNAFHKCTETLLVECVLWFFLKKQNNNFRITCGRIRLIIRVKKLSCYS